MGFRIFKNTNCIGLDIFGRIHFFGIAYLFAVKNLPLLVIDIIVLLVLLYLPFTAKKHFEKYKEPEEERLLYATLITISAIVISFYLVTLV